MSGQRLGERQLVVRREIRSLPRSEQERFCDAVERMMRPSAAGAPRSSEYFRLAGNVKAPLPPDDNHVFFSHDAVN